MVLPIFCNVQVLVIIKIAHKTGFNQAITSMRACRDVMKLIAMFKFQSLSELDGKTGLFPFMLSTQKKRCNN